MRATLAQAACSSMMPRSGARIIAQLAERLLNTSTRVIWGARRSLRPQHARRCMCRVLHPNHNSSAAKAVTRQRQWAAYRCGHQPYGKFIKSRMRKWG
ncbi:hypothetical protein PHLGIDRAFT_310477 [Phlebiopsis gigantea 11061_1 CR5-6]|uniref:Uncharacterized protein n=1 Tax=Phlebiopsis gigantea (strain 11061_1 CR5-6) TaxID=745531 RepID=A0A0C3S2Y1_PHLG1|nr:hypothetical protein PHLGIDRAFT_310477 [Phlebiopsis gigantea 11061_1 CR5-6]